MTAYNEFLSGLCTKLGNTYAGEPFKSYENDYLAHGVHFVSELNFTLGGVWEGEWKWTNHCLFGGHKNIGIIYETLASVSLFTQNGIRFLKQKAFPI